MKNDGRVLQSKLLVGKGIHSGPCCPGEASAAILEKTAAFVPFSGSGFPMSHECKIRLGQLGS